MVTRPVKIETTGHATIRARLYSPIAHPKPYRAAVLAHPYHHHTEGSYNNHLICSLATTLESLGFLVITFNFRRRKSSWSGHTEMEDMKCAIDWLLHRPGHEAVTELTIAGYSYGALIASAVQPLSITDRRIKLSYLLISMPLRISKYYLWMFPKPSRVYNKHRTLAIWGSKDAYAPLRRVHRKGGRRNLEILVLGGSQHFIEDEQHKINMLAFICKWADGIDTLDVRGYRKNESSPSGLTNPAMHITRQSL